jgi:hypothetical protein
LGDEDARAEKWAQNEAESFLRNVLNAAGGSALAVDIQRDAKAAGISWRTIERAKGRLKVVSKRDSFGGKWRWEIRE